MKSPSGNRGIGMDDKTFNLLLENDKEWRRWMIEQMSKLNGRVRRLEVWRGFITGGLTLLAIIVGYLIKVKM